MAMCVKEMHVVNVLKQYVYHQFFEGKSHALHTTSFGELSVI